MIRKATVADMPQLLQLVNSAYRGPQAKKGWTHEANLIEGELRADEPYMLEQFGDPNSVILAYIVDEKILGCVYLRRRDKTLFLGMLSVAPEVQTGGIGKQLLRAAEDHARNEHCTAIEITVISVRHELLAWYERQGYRRTGDIKPFEEDARFGTPRQEIEFLVMEKRVSGE